MIPLRLVLDTNIIVSAALKPDGLQRTVLLLALTKPARLYVNEAEQAALIVNDLKQPSSNGGVALWVGQGTIAHFAGLKVISWARTH